MKKTVLGLIGLAVFIFSAVPVFAQVNMPAQKMRGNVRLENISVEETGEYFPHMEDLYDNLVANQVQAQHIKRERLETLEEFNARKSKLSRSWEKNYVGMTFKVKTKVNLSKLMMVDTNSDDCLIKLFPFTEPYDARNSKSVTFFDPNAAVTFVDKTIIHSAEIAKGEFCVNCYSDVKTLREQLLPFENNFYVEFSFIVKQFDKPVWLIELKSFRLYIDSSRDRDAKEMKFVELCTVESTSK